MTAPLSGERLAEIESVQLGEWLAGGWCTEYVEGDGEEPACYRVKSAEGIVLATLPDWAGPIATLLADAHEAVPELLAEVRRLREAEAGRAMVRPGSRRDLLLLTVLAEGGEWTVGRVKALYAESDCGHIYRATIRADLGALHRAGHLALHDADGQRFYTLAGGAL